MENEYGYLICNQNCDYLNHKHPNSPRCNLTYEPEILGVCQWDGNAIMSKICPLNPKS